MRLLVDVDEVGDVGEVRARVAAAVQMRCDHRRLLRRTGVVEAQARVDVGRAAQPEQARAGAHGEQVAEHVAREGDVGRRCAAQRHHSQRLSSITS